MLAQILACLQVRSATTTSSKSWTTVHGLGFALRAMQLLYFFLSLGEPNRKSYLQAGLEVQGKATLVLIKIFELEGADDCWQDQCSYRCTRRRPGSCETNERISSIQLPAVRWQGWAGPHASRSRVVHSVILGDDSINMIHIIVS